MISATATKTPFVSTPQGIGVIQCSDAPESEFFVRFEDGTRCWVDAQDCTRDVEQPSWYVAPDPSGIAGWVR